MDGAPVVLTAVNSRGEADLIVGLLRSAGLRAAAVTDDAGGQEPQLALQGGVRVLVAAEDEGAARRLLAETTEAPDPAETGRADPPQEIRSPHRKRRPS